MTKFKIDDRVAFNRTNSTLDGKTGSVIGFGACYPEVQWFIVLLDKPIVGRPDKALLMIGSSLDPAP